MPSSPAVSIRVVRNLGEIEEIRGVWSAWNRQPNSDIDFYLTVLRCGPEVVRPHIIVLNRGGLPNALLIGRIEDTRFELKMGYRTVFRPAARTLTFVNGGFLGNESPENCKVLVHAVKGALRKGEADLAFFNLLRTDSPFFRHGLRSPFLAVQPHRAFVLPDTVEELYQSMSPKVRENVRWRAKKLLHDYPRNVTVRCFRSTGELERAVQDVEEVAKRTYQRGLGVGFVDSSMMRQRLHFEAQKGWLQVYVLYVADEPCAFWLGALYQDTFYGSYTGYDPSYAKYSPGMFLFMRVIEDFCGSNGHHRVREINWGFGDAQYKSFLGNREWQESSIYLFSPTLRGVRLRFLTASMMLADRLARRVLIRAGLLTKAKKVWRDRLRGKAAPSLASDGGKSI